MFTDYLRISLNNLWQRKLRNFLTVIGIVIGIMAVVALISIGQGLQGSVRGEFEKIGYDKISIQGGSVSYGPPGTGSGKLTKKDLDTVKKVDGVKDAIPSTLKISKIEYRETEGITMFLGIPKENIGDFFSGNGSYEIEKGNEPAAGKVCIGSRIASGEFWGNNTNKNMKTDIRSKVKIGEGQSKKTFGVSCIMKETGEPNGDSTVYMLTEDYTGVFNMPEDEFNVIYVGVKKGYDVDKAAEKIKKELKDSRGNDDFQVQTVKQWIEAFDSVFGILNMVLIGIASISLVVGGVGIMNTIYTSVLERTREIGVMKAIGATNNNILSIFLIESGILGFIGGVIGCAIGILLGKIVEIGAHQSGYAVFSANTSPELIAGALMFSVVVGVVAGILPARQASGLKPVDALKHE